MTVEWLLYIAVMAGVTYLIRMSHLTVFRRKITNRFLKSFLYYIPYAVLGAMTIPWIFYSTGNFVTAAFGAAVAFVLALFRRSLITVALASCAAAYLSGLVLQLWF